VFFSGYACNENPNPRGWRDWIALAAECALSKQKG
jgi:hypothetical protein